MFGWKKRRRPKVIAFDVIGTLFPLEPLRPRIEEMGLPPLGLEAWFAAALRDAFAISASGDFKPFTTILEQALDQVVAEQDLAPERRLRTGLIAAMESLVAREDARAAFEAAAKAEIQVVALSNGAARLTRKLIGSAGLEPLVHRIISVEEVKLYKPRPEVYRHAARLCKVKPKRVALVAVHPWDIHGAKAAGLTTAYLNSERPFPSVMGTPDTEAQSLIAATELLIAL
jgi:2-haloacid dehalogenase